MYLSVCKSTHNTGNPKSGPDDRARFVPSNYYSYIISIQIKTHGATISATPICIPVRRHIITTCLHIIHLNIIFIINSIFKLISHQHYNLDIRLKCDLDITILFDYCLHNLRTWIQNLRNLKIVYTYIEICYHIK